MPNAVTLLNAIEYGLKNNRAIINANRDVKKAYKDKWNTIALGLPQIISSVDYQNFIELQAKGDFGDNSNIMLGFHNPLVASPSDGPGMSSILFSSLDLALRACLTFLIESGSEVRGLPDILSPFASTAPPPASVAQSF